MVFYSTSLFSNDILIMTHTDYLILPNRNHGPNSPHIHSHSSPCTSLSPASIFSMFSALRW